MDNTRFSNICKILSDLLVASGDDANLDWFFDVYDLGVPFAVGYVEGSIELNDKGKEHVMQAWIGLCDFLNLDYHADFDDLDEMMRFADEG